MMAGPTRPSQPTPQPPSSAYEAMTGSHDSGRTTHVQVVGKLEQSTLGRDRDLHAKDWQPELHAGGDRSQIRQQAPARCHTTHIGVCSVTAALGPILVGVGPTRTPSE